MAFITYNNKYLQLDGNFLWVSQPKLSLEMTGYIMSDQGSLIIEKGFIYGISPENLNNIVISTNLSDYFTAIALVITGIYYYKAYATNGSGTSYGDLKSIIIK